MNTDKFGLLAKLPGTGSTDLAKPLLWLPASKAAELFGMGLARTSASGAET
jgi:hypothetical protein